MPEYINIAEFRERGYLHEVNRLVLHPLGLALSVSVTAEPGREISFTEEDTQEILLHLENTVNLLTEHDSERTVVEKLIHTIKSAPLMPKGHERLADVWDSRDDPEGIYFGDDLLNPEKAARVCEELLTRRAARLEALKYVVQPIPDARVLTTNYLDPDRVKVTPDLEFEQ